LKLKCDKLLSSFAFNFNLRHYKVVVTTSWINASLAVAAAAGCSGAGSAFTGEASIDLAWLNSVGTPAGTAAGFRRCAADVTVAGDEVWHVAVAAGSVAAEVVGPYTYTPRPERLTECNACCVIESDSMILSHATSYM